MNLLHFLTLRHGGTCLVNFWPLLVVVTVLIAKSQGMVYLEALNMQELDILFGEEECVEGTLSVSEIGNVEIQSILFTESKVENDLLGNVEDKSPMSMLNELAFFNQIKYHYILTGEEGPAHNKRFNVSLYLGEESYSALGTSIKNAQHSTAKLAMKSTKYNHPTKRDIITKKINKARKESTSIQKLEDMINKNWDESLVYSYQEQSSRSLNNFYHDNMYSKPSFHKVSVRVGKQEYTGEGLTLEIAKEKAASNALHELNNVNGFCLLEKTQGNLLNKFFYIDDKNDSPISLIHEFATRSKQKISFEIISEGGPSHMKEFTSKCNIGNKFTSFGKGSTKKAAKKEAALHMIEKLKSYAYDSNIKCGSMIKKNKRPKRRNSNKLIKSVTTSNNGEIKHQYSFPDSINPISKLLQIQQLNHDIMPIFTLLEEKGETVKTFLIEVKVGNLAYVGAGTNKKTAKRKAAEGMSEMLGYSRTSEKSRVSLSDEKKKQFFNKGGTTSKTPLVSGLHLNSDTASRMDYNTESNDINSPGKIKTNKKVESKFTSNDNDIKARNNNNPDETNEKSPKTQLDDISHELRFRFQFSDFPKSNNSGFVSLLSLTTNPPKVCFGIGLTTDISQDKAAEAALTDLYKSHVAAISDILQESSKFKVYEDSIKLVQKTVKEDIITEL